MSDPTALRDADLERAVQHGLTPDEVHRQLHLLREPPPAMSLDRPCTVGDGISRIDDDQVPALLEAQEAAVAGGRATYFVPASGAATRMFKSLLALRQDGDVDRSALESADSSDARETLRFLDGLERFAFRGVLDGELRRRGTSLDACLRSGAVGAVLEALLDEDGLGYAETPKGLLPFHRYGADSRAAFDEHLVEASAIASGADGRVRLHFTVSPAHRGAFSHRAGRGTEALRQRLDRDFDIGFSTQKPSTDTIAVDLEGRPFRDEQDELLFRPGGHGSLVANLADLAQRGADLIYVKNIDNIVHDDWRTPVVHWRRLLAGRLASLQARIFDALRAMDRAPDDPAPVAHGAALLKAELGVELPAPAPREPHEAASAIRRLLDRPLRVCAMLVAEGHAGGGPFWVRAANGALSAQIVESAQIDSDSEEQKAIERRATHFSPADMVLGVRDHLGRPFDLHRHVDRDAVFIAEKSSGGRGLRALEHPGLWNGGMSDWNTVFVEVPTSIFQPVKTVNDLLGPAHQPA